MLTLSRVLFPLAILNLAILNLASTALAMDSQSIKDIALYPQRSAQAQVVSLNESRIPADISAPIARITVEPGQVVKKGALLVVLDCRDYDLARARAEAALKASESQARLSGMQLTRSSKLADQGFIAKEALDSRQAEHEVALAETAVNRAGLKTAQHAQSKCKIRAPFPAVVLERLGHEGEMAGPGSPLLLLSDLSHIQIKAEVQWEDAEDLGVAQGISFQTQGKAYPVKLAQRSPALNRSTRLMEARLKFAGPTAPPGSTGRVFWNSHQAYLPPEITVRRGGQIGIYILEGSTPRFLPLPQAQEGRPVPVNLPMQTRIVTQGQNDLR